MKALLRPALLAAALGASACASHLPKPASGSTEATRALVIRFLDALDRGDWATLDQMVTADYKHHVVTATGFSERTWETFRKGNRAARLASPDWKNTPVQIAVDGNRAAVLLAGHGTHLGSFGGEKPTGKTMDLPVAVFLEIRGDKIAADWRFRTQRRSCVNSRSRDKRLGRVGPAANNSFKPSPLRGLGRAP